MFGVPRLLGRKRKRSIMFYKNNDILPSVFTLPIENLQSAKVPITAVLPPCIPHALTNTQNHSEKALDFIHQSGLHLPCSKTNYPKVLLTDKPSHPEEIKKRWRRIENHSKTCLCNPGTAGATFWAIPQGTGSRQVGQDCLVPSSWWSLGMSSSHLLLPSWPLQEGRAWPKPPKAPQHLINVHLETPVASLVQCCLDETHWAVLSSNGVGRVKGKQHQGLGPWGSVETIPPPSLPQLLWAKVHTEVLGQTLYRN